MIYLSNFATAGKDDRAVSIAAITPRGFKGEVRRDLAPPFSLVKAYKAGKINDVEYIIEYGKQIYALDLDKIAADLDGRIALCYCAKTDFCHRQLLGLILYNELGVKVEEIGGFGERFAYPFEEVGNPYAVFLTPEEAAENKLQDLKLVDRNIVGWWKELKARGLTHLYNTD